MVAAGAMSAMSGAAMGTAASASPVIGGLTASDGAEVAAVNAVGTHGGRRSGRRIDTLLGEALSSSRTATHFGRELVDDAARRV